MDDLTGLLWVRNSAWVRLVAPAWGLLDDLSSTDPRESSYIPAGSLQRKRLTISFSDGNVSGPTLS